MDTLAPRPPIVEQIGETKYRVTPFSTSKGFEVMSHITGLLRSAVASGASNKEEVIAQAIGSLTEKELVYFTNTFAAVTDINTPKTGANWPGLSQLVELHFAANYGEWCAWLAFCLKLNYGSLFTWATAAVAANKNPPAVATTATIPASS